MNTPDKQANDKEVSSLGTTETERTEEDSVRQKKKTKPSVLIDRFGDRPNESTPTRTATRSSKRLQEKAAGLVPAPAATTKQAAKKNAPKPTPRTGTRRSSRIQKKVVNDAKKASTPSSNKPKAQPAKKKRNTQPRKLPVQKKARKPSKKAKESDKKMSVSEAKATIEHFGEIGAPEAGVVQELPEVMEIPVSENKFRCPSCPPPPGKARFFESKYAKYFPVVARAGGQEDQPIAWDWDRSQWVNHISRRYMEDNPQADVKYERRVISNHLTKKMQSMDEHFKKQQEKYPGCSGKMPPAFVKQQKGGDRKKKP